MNANELKAKARERLAEIAKQRAALDAEEREICVMLGDVPPAPTVNPLREWERMVQPIAPMPYDVYPFGRLFDPCVVTCSCEGGRTPDGNGGVVTHTAGFAAFSPGPVMTDEARAFIASQTTGCAVTA